MTKPEDIPRLSARQVASELSMLNFEGMVEIISHALRAAEQREREACAALCGGLRHPDQSAESEDWVEGTFACRDAILNRGEIQGD